MPASNEDSRHRILVSTPLIGDAIHDYAELFADYGIAYDVADVDQQLDETQLLDVLPGYDGIIAGDDELTAEVVAGCPRLEVVSKWGIGTDGIDFDAADRHDVAVYNTPGAFSDEVADVVIGYALMLARRLHHVDREVRDGNWHAPRGVSLAGRTMGIVGVGNVGSAVARRAVALGMDVVGYDIDPISQSLREATDIEAVGFDTLLDRADVVSLNCTLNDSTAGMIDTTALERIGSDGYLINTARGKLVVEDDLVTALHEGTVAGAALDVFETEPLPADSPLAEFENVVLGSHNAQNTGEAVARVNDRAVANLIEGLTGEIPSF